LAATGPEAGGNDRQIDIVAFEPASPVYVEFEHIDGEIERIIRFQPPGVDDIEMGCSGNANHCERSGFSPPSERSGIVQPDNPEVSAGRSEFFMCPEEQKIATIDEE
jgi:hypothetical protein